MTKICDECECVAHCTKNGCVPKVMLTDGAVGAVTIAKLAEAMWVKALPLMDALRPDDVTMNQPLTVEQIARIVHTLAANAVRAFQLPGPAQFGAAQDEPVAWQSSFDGVAWGWCTKEHYTSIMNDPSWAKDGYCGRALYTRPSPVVPAVPEGDKLDAARYRFIADRYLGADFEWGASEKTVLLVDHDGLNVFGSLDLTIDAAMQAAGAAK